jgi:hypothetical protein
MSLFSLILESSGIDGDTSLFLLRGFIDFIVGDVFGFLLSGEVFSDGGCEGSFTVIDMADGTD